MKISQLILSITLASLAGCATTVCTTQEVDAINAENQRLEQLKPTITSYLAGADTPMSKYSRLPQSVLADSYAREYNSAVGHLERRAARFNAVCIPAEALGCWQGICQVIFTIYETSTGRVLSSGWVHIEDLQGVGQEGQSILEGVQHVGGWITDGEHFPQPPQPGPHHLFNWAAKVWEDPRTSVQIKAQQWARIKALRDARKVGGVQVGDKWFHSDEASRIQQIGLVMMGANLPADLQWKTMDGSFVTMTQTLAMQIFGAAAASDQATFGKAEQHRTAMEASSDPEAYDFTPGWPAIYGETP
ncbi:DUF4376 domain-containing protein [Polaromonas sp. P1(28)-13]|nr:DUF4376 domain-containing protein [Polaromonas sp. P1(28)-13]